MRQCWTECQCHQVETQQLQSKHFTVVTSLFKTPICPVHTSLFWSHHLVFPALVPVPATFPQSGRHRSVRCLYLLCVLWQNRGKWLWRWRGPRALQRNANNKLLSHKARRDKVGRCRRRERERDKVWWNTDPQWGAETGSPPTHACSLLSLDTVWQLAWHHHWSTPIQEVTTIQCYRYDAILNGLGDFLFTKMVQGKEAQTKDGDIKEYRITQ